MQRKLFGALLATTISFAAANAMAADAPKTLNPTPKAAHHMHHKGHAVHHEMAEKCTPKETQALQQSLRDSGFYKGTVTGKWDQSTSNALASYQHANGLTVTGKLDDKTYKSLGLHPIAKEKMEGAAKPMLRHGHKMHHKGTKPAHAEMKKADTAKKTSDAAKK